MNNLTPRERLELCLKDTTVRAPRLEQMAALLKADGRYEVKIFRTSCTKDRKIGRLLWPGVRTYTGKILEVTRRNEVLFHHDTTDTYRTNHELARKVLDLLT